MIFTPFFKSHDP